MAARSSSPSVSQQRPGAAVAAGVLGIVVGGQILIGSFAEWGYAVEHGVTWLLVVIALIGALWLVGGIQMLGGSRGALLIGSVAWLMLMVALLVWGWINTLANPGTSMTLVWVFVSALVFAAVPVIILTLAFRPTVTNWINER